MTITPTEPLRLYLTRADVCDALAPLLPAGVACEPIGVIYEGDVVVGGHLSHALLANKLAVYRRSKFSIFDWETGPMHRLWHRLHGWWDAIGVLRDAMILMARLRPDLRCGLYAAGSVRYTLPGANGSGNQFWPASTPEQRHNESLWWQETWGTILACSRVSVPSCYDRTTINNGCDAARTGAQVRLCVTNRVDPCLPFMWTRRPDLSRVDPAEFVRDQFAPSWGAGCRNAVLWLDHPSDAGTAPQVAATTMPYIRAMVAHAKSTPAGGGS